MSTVPRRAVPVLAALGLALPAAPAAAQTAPSFAQLTGSEGCLVPAGEGLPEDLTFDLPEGCGTTLAGASSVAISEDGHAAYVTAADQSAVSRFSRDTETGRLTQRGCLKQLVRPGERCTLAPALAGAADVAASPDDKHVYVAAQRSRAIAVMKVDPADGAHVTSSRSGALVILGVEDSGDLIATGCFLARAPKGPCTSARLLEGAQDAALTHDARSLLVVASEKGALIGYARRLPAGSGVRPAHAVRVRRRRSDLQDV